MTQFRHQYLKAKCTLCKKPYPPRLIPKKASKTITKIDLTNNLCRWTEPDLLTVQSMVDSFRDSHFNRFSCNNLGYSKVKDCRLFIKRSEYLNPWQDGVDCKKLTKRDFNIKRRKCFLIPIDKIHLKEFKIPVDNLSKEVKKNLGKNITEYIFKFRVTHSPVVSNFSHFEIWTCDANDQEITGINKSDWKKKNMLSMLRNLLKRNGSIPAM